jgi:hypothetical protein
MGDAVRARDVGRRGCPRFVYTLQTGGGNESSLGARKSAQVFQFSTDAQSRGLHQPVANFVPDTQPTHLLRSLVASSARLQALSDSLR